MPKNLTLPRVKFYEAHKKFNPYGEVLCLLQKVHPHKVKFYT
nr:MAG TPA: hypothetical protein [Caudoviricetes sp.]DAH95953.1 MAG TPA: hypothetical protein [Caudoviricetes sp.]